MLESHTHQLNHRYNLLRVVRSYLISLKSGHLARRPTLVRPHLGENCDVWVTEGELLGKTSEKLVNRYTMDGFSNFMSETNFEPNPLLLGAHRAVGDIRLLRLGSRARKQADFVGGLRWLEPVNVRSRKTPLARRVSLIDRYRCMNDHTNPALHIFSRWSVQGPRLFPARCCGDAVRRLGGTWIVRVYTMNIVHTPQFKESSVISARAFFPHLDTSCYATRHSFDLNSLSHDCKINNSYARHRVVSQSIRFPSPQICRPTSESGNTAHTIQVLPRGYLEFLSKWGHVAMHLIGDRTGCPFTLPVQRLVLENEASKN